MPPDFQVNRELGGDSDSCHFGNRKNFFSHEDTALSKFVTTRAPWTCAARFFGRLILRLNPWILHIHILI